MSSSFSSSFSGDNKKKSFSLKRAFLKATLGGALLFGSYQYYTPEPVKDAIGDKVSDVLHTDQKLRDVQPEDLRFTLENGRAPNILGTQTAGVFQASDNLMNEWFSAMGRHEQLLKNSDNAANFKKWLLQLSHLQGKSIAEKAKGVDALVDQQIKYAQDPETYKKDEYFASPMETLRARQGDCDDFAILKYYALRYLGVPADKMFIVTVGSEGGKLDHATLMVDIRQPGLLKGSWEAVTAKVFKAETPADFIILDNDGSEAGKLVEARDTRYHPYHAMNENGVWRVARDSKLNW